MVLLALNVVGAEELRGCVMDLSAGEFGGVFGVGKNEPEGGAVVGKVAFFVKHFGI